MELRQIKHFLAVVDHGSFSAAAKHTFVTQPSISSSISKLEESLEVSLFRRQGKQIELTSKGEQFLVTARHAYNQLSAIKSELSEGPQKLTIGVATSIHMDQMTKMIRAFKVAHPHVVINFYVGRDSDVAISLKENKIDLAIVNSHTKCEGFVPIVKELLCIAVANNHFLAKKKSLSLRDLNDIPFIERLNCGFWSKVNRQFIENNIRPQTIVQVENDEFVLSLVAENLGASIVTARSTPYKVKFIPIEDLKIDQYIGVAFIHNAENKNIANFYNTVATNTESLSF